MTDDAEWVRRCLGREPRGRYAVVARDASGRPSVIRNEPLLDDGTPINFALFDAAIQTIDERLPQHGLPGQQRLPQAAWLLTELTHAHQLADFLTLPAYALLP